MIFKKLARMRQLVLEQVFPTHCLICGQGGEGFCAACVGEQQEHLKNSCTQCALPLASLATSTDLICGTCLSTPPAYDRTLATMLYRAPFDQTVLALKYRAQLAIAPLFAQRLAQAILQSAIQLDALVPVPLSRMRLAQRGFNQALEIAKPLARQLKIPCIAEAALRIRDTIPQASLELNARQQNIRAAFVVIAKISNLRIGIVDDVMTTGATLHELAQQLKLAGAGTVVNLVVARTPLH